MTLLAVLKTYLDHMKQFLNKYATFTNKSTLDTIKDTDVYAWGKAAEHAGNSDVHVDSAYKNDIKKRLEDLESIDHPEEYYNTQYIGDSTGTTIESYLKNLPNGTIAWSCNLDFFTDGNDWITKYEIGQYPTIMLKKSKDYHCFLIMFCDYKLLYWMGDTTTSITGNVWTVPIGLENNTYQINNRWLNITGLANSNKAHVIMGVDNEGANLELKSDNGTIYQFDTNQNGFRLYRIDEDGSNYKVLMNLSGENGDMLGISGSAHQATCDADGNVIGDTYLKSNGLSTGYANGSNYIWNPMFKQVALAQRNGATITGMSVSRGTIEPWDSSSSTVPKISVGYSAKPWNGFYSYVAPTIVSDKRQKENIHDINVVIIDQLIDMINAVTYQLKEGESGRTHYGMISQQVEEVLNALGIDSKDFAAFIKSPVMEDIMEQATDEEGNLLFDDDENPIMIKVGEKETGEYTYMLRYEEFIPILWKNAQDKNQKIQELEEDNQKLHQEIDELRSIVLDLASMITN